MRLKESIIIILLLFILIGGLNAADNQTDDLTVSDNDIVAVDVTPVDESTDSSGIKTVEQNISNVAKATSNGEILSASAQNDVLGGTRDQINSAFGNNGEFELTDQQYDWGTGNAISLKASSVTGNYNGQRVVIDASGATKAVFTTTANTNDIVISNFYFKNFNSQTDASGGVFQITNNKVITFNNCVFDSNTVGYAGGVIFATTGTININNCEFINNKNTQTGTSANNQEPSGGAISCSGTSTLNVLNSKFINNYAVKLGGAIICSSSSSKVSASIKNSNFTGNHAGEGAGAIQISKFQSLTIDNCKFDDNYATTGSGGALYVGNGPSDSNTKIINSKFTNNKANGGPGGALGMASTPAPVVFNCSFDNNFAQDRGAVSILSSATDADVSYCNFTNNEANTGAAGLIIGNNNKKVTLKNIIFKDNICHGYGLLFIYIIQ